jgi:hypothetical protein
MGMVLSVERWHEFMYKLGEALFAERDEDDRRTSRCEHDHRYAMKIMTEMGDIVFWRASPTFRKTGATATARLASTLILKCQSIDLTNNGEQNTN